MRRKTICNQLIDWSINGSLISIVVMLLYSDLCWRFHPLSSLAMDLLFRGSWTELVPNLVACLLDLGSGSKTLPPVTIFRYEYYQLSAQRIYLFLSCNWAPLVEWLQWKFDISLSIFKVVFCFDESFQVYLPIGSTCVR